MCPKVSSKSVKPINIGLIGFGNIGKGVVQYFTEGRGKKFNIHLKKVVVSDLTKPRKPHFTSLTNNVSDVLNDPEIDIVVELMGGVDVARKHILKALNNGKSVVTANKAVISRHAKELFEAARSKSVDLAFEASVGGGIPIIKTINAYKGEKIKRIMGVLNGTTNYILTLMEDGLGFEKALIQAQEKGFAEANHILDTGGFDTRDKLAILASLIFNTQVDLEKIDCKGITEITPADIDFAAKFGTEDGGRGYAIKLLAIASKHNGSVELQVRPALIPKDHPLALVRNEYNGVYLEGELAGPQIFLGKGAGTLPTTSAVISDILRVADNIRYNTPDELPLLNSSVSYVESSKLKHKGYIRVNLKHRPGSLAAVSEVLAKHGLNIEDAIQKQRYGENMKGEHFIPYIITMQTAPKKIIESAIADVALCKRIQGPPFFLSFEE